LFLKALTHPFRTVFSFKGLHAAEDLFDLDVFQDNPAPFYKYAQSHFVSSARKEIRPSPSHLFLSMLHEQKQLLRVYTQNIDGLEEVAGIPTKKVVYAHGSLGWAQCMKCKSKVDSVVIAQEMEEGQVPLCQKTSKKRKLNRSTSITSSSSKSLSSDLQADLNKPSARPKRSCSAASIAREAPVSLDSSSSMKTYEGPARCNGVMKPGVTFFGEKLHSNVARLLETDRKKADALIVIGTSLSV
jgi:NAD-dependent SIR2 family protein deacetylase